ncbi:hypothetical protein LJC08_05820 [Methanimicrococcus sp. OttesenSCG-928-J09]|nr:hypothetical protein [Methanimicrococcus sp. OttesenSCG-928-J09]
MKINGRGWTSIFGQNETSFFHQNLKKMKRRFSMKVVFFGFWKRGVWI